MGDVKGSEDKDWREAAIRALMSAAFHYQGKQPLTPAMLEKLLKTRPNP